MPGRAHRAANGALLGEINDSQQAQWIRAIEVFDEDRGALEQIKLFAAERPLPEAAPDWCSESRYLRKVCQDNYDGSVRAKMGCELRLRVFMGVGGCGFARGSAGKRLLPVDADVADRRLAAGDR